MSHADYHHIITNEEIILIKVRLSHADLSSYYYEWRNKEYYCSAIIKFVKLVY